MARCVWIACPDLRCAGAGGGTGDVHQASAPTISATSAEKNIKITIHRLSVRPLRGLATEWGPEHRRQDGPQEQIVTLTIPGSNGPHSNRFGRWRYGGL